MAILQRPLIENDVNPIRHEPFTKFADLAQTAAQTGHWLVPTLVVLRGLLMSPEDVAAQWQRKQHRRNCGELDLDGMLDIRSRTAAVFTYEP